MEIKSNTAIKKSVAEPEAVAKPEAILSPELVSCSTIGSQRKGQEKPIIAPKRHKQISNFSLITVKRKRSSTSPTTQKQRYQAT